jgi:chromosome segregation protein
MRLTRLELFGFKSFADRTVLEFEHGLTGIVGPNGCGKSNVVDAVRWVLGERRPTSMRGAEMTDVIFKGSASRPAMSVAEVTLVLDNDCGTIEDHGPEVSISRRVFKSGEGEYMIDGSKVRLKDLRDMLFDTGLGSRGYAILEQGKIDAVLSADAMERRSIFEEAAGISRFRQRKKEAESRLKSVARDMVRLEDVVRELERRQRSLKIQAGKAERYVAAREEWTTEGTRYARHQLARLTDEMMSLTDKLGLIEGRGQELRALREAAEGDVGAREREQLTLTAELERLGAQASEVAGDLRALDERRSQLSSRVQAWKDSASTETIRAQELEVRVEQRETELHSVTSKLGELETQAKEAETRVTSQGEKAKQAFEAYRDARQSFGAQNDVVLGLLHERTRAQNSKKHLGASLAPLAARATRGEDRLAEARENLSGAVQQLTADEAAKEKATADATVLGERREELNTNLESAKRDLGEANGERRRLELEAARLSTRVESLLDWTNEREGLDSGTRALFEKGADAGIQEGGLSGLVADHLRCASEHAAALSASLGAWSEAVVLKDPERAEGLVQWLRDKEHGLARLATVPGFAHSARTEELKAAFAALGDTTGVVGPLRDYVDTNEGFSTLADHLIGDTYLVETTALAVRLAAKIPGLRCVTLMGDVATAAGLVGGSRDAQDGAVGRRALAAELEVELASLNAANTKASDHADACLARTEVLQRELASARDGAHDARARAAKLESSVSGGKRRVRDLEEGAEIYLKESGKLEEEQSRIANELAEVATTLGEVNSRFDLENVALEGLDVRRRELEGARDESSRQEGQARIEWTRLSGEFAGEKRRADHLASSLLENRSELERTQTMKLEHAESATEGASEFEKLGQQRVIMLAKRGDLDGKLRELRERDTAGREIMDELRRRADAVTRELEGLMDESGKRQLDKQRVELSREELLRRSEEEFKLDYEALTLDFEADEELSVENALDALASAVGGLKRNLDRLGPVNLEAVSELEEVTERLDFLIDQRRDLNESRRALEETIEKINVESERLFLEAFHEIRGNFQSIFRKLFGGGKADIILEADVSPLEAGIEIYARPPGRENLPIGLLSGGQRTMIALALLFAVFEARPSPFCMLDEVDAALDDANIDRFLKMIGLFRDMSQFIVVTHNKGSMAECDALYGITMQPRGISRHVVMELADVDEFVPDVVDGKKDGEADEPIVELTPQSADSDERDPGEAMAEGQVEPAEAASTGGAETTPEGALASPRP